MMKKLIHSGNEKHLFLVIVILNLTPIITGKFFPTLDGPAHLHNSELIYSLLFGNSELINDFYVLNPEIVPNWTGHFILLVLNSFLPGFIAEKILLIIYLIGLSYAFRLLIKRIAPENVFMSYFIFPFTYSILFILGFYNFCCALVLLFCTLNFWLKHEDSIASSPKRIIQLFLLITITYFSHVFVFAILLLVIALNILTTTIINLKREFSLKNEILLTFRTKIKAFLLASFIPLILFSYYFFSRGVPKNNVEIPTQELIKQLFDIKSIITYIHSESIIITRIIISIISILIVVSIFNRVCDKKSGKPNEPFFRITDVWLIISIMILYLYFTSPDSNEFGGFISVRLQLFFFLFLILWICFQKLSKKVTIVVASVLVVCQLYGIFLHTKNTRHFKQVAYECNEISKKIPANSVVFPINVYDNWLAGHISNYMGIDKPLIILENYECENNYFPLKWNNEKIPTPLIGETPVHSFPCIFWTRPQTEKTIPIEYILTIGNLKEKTEDCYVEISNIINQHYKPIDSLNLYTLYKLKR
jgi:hypothetical protein